MKSTSFLEDVPIRIIPMIHIFTVESGILTNNNQVFVELERETGDWSSAGLANVYNANA